ncbi:MAG: hypothetical protein Ct9H90mP22_8760 [Gammaproteobacteria bacterium]|nr:MAG: hypothetical protein Ct9H90mP22_8760 [Gammaproteobacteria bacterium]
MPDNFVSGDSERGSQLVESCSACHGTDGNSISSDWPKLAGQNKSIYMNNYYFKDGVRMNALMMSVTPYLQTLDMKIFLISLHFIRIMKLQLDKPRMMKNYLILAQII